MKIGRASWSELAPINQPEWLKSSRTLDFVPKISHWSISHWRFANQINPSSHNQRLSKYQIESNQSIDKNPLPTFRSRQMSPRRALKINRQFDMARSIGAQRRVTVTRNASAKRKKICNNKWQKAISWGTAIEQSKKMVKWFARCMPDNLITSSILCPTPQQTQNIGPIRPSTITHLSSDLESWSVSQLSSKWPRNRDLPSPAPFPVVHTPPGILSNSRVFASMRATSTTRHSHYSPFLLFFF